MKEMNLGWYEIMDRISVIQNQLEDFVSEHQQADDELKEMIDKAQDALSDAYSYAGNKYYTSIDGECYE